MFLCLLVLCVAFFYLPLCAFMCLVTWIKMDDNDDDDDLLLTTATATATTITTTTTTTLCCHLCQEGHCNQCRPAQASMRPPGPKERESSLKFFWPPFFSHHPVTVNLTTLLVVKNLQQLHLNGSLYLALSGVTVPFHRHIRPFATTWWAPLPCEVPRPRGWEFGGGLHQLCM